MMTIGVVGFSFIIHSKFEEPALVHNNSSLDIDNTISTSPQRLSFTEIQRCDEKNRVSIKLISADFNDKFLIDFGDGKISTIREADFTYEYPKHGHYVLSLIKKDAFKETVLEKKSLDFFPI